jgi:hypothetical protein
MAKRKVPQPLYGAESPGLCHADNRLGAHRRAHTISQVILTMGLHESEHFASVYNFLLKSRWDLPKWPLRSS